MACCLEVLDGWAHIVDILLLNQNHSKENIVLSIPGIKPLVNSSKNEINLFMCKAVDV